MEDKYYLDTMEILNNIKDNIEDCNYEIESPKESWHKYIKHCKNKKQRLQIMMCLYMVNPTLEELQTWDIKTYLRYVRETDNCFNNRFYNSLLKGDIR